jgi:hypothetical protein
MFDPFKNVLKDHRFRWDEDGKAAVVPASARRVLCIGDPVAGVKMECLPYCPRKLFLTACTPSPRTVLMYLLSYE